MSASIASDPLRSERKLQPFDDSRTVAHVRIAVGIKDASDGASHILLADVHIDSHGSHHAEPDAPVNTTMNPELFDRAARIDHIFAERGRFEVLAERPLRHACGATAESGCRRRANP